MAVHLDFERIGAYPPPTGEAALAAALQRIKSLEDDLKAHRRTTEGLERTVEAQRQQLRLLKEAVALPTATIELKGEVGELAAKVERVAREGYILDKVVWQLRHTHAHPPQPPTITFNLNDYQVPVEAVRVLLEIETQYLVAQFVHHAQSTVSCEGFAETFPLTFPSAQRWIPVSPGRTFTMSFPSFGPSSVIKMVKIIRYR